MNPGGIGDLVITVGGDLSALEAALDQIPQLAQSAFGGIQDAIGGIDWSPVTDGAQAASDAIASVTTDSSTATDALDAVSESLSTSGDAASAAGDGVTGLSEAMTATSAAADTATTSAEQLAPAIEDVASSSDDAESGLAGMAESLVALGEGLAVTEGLKELATEAITAADAEQSTVISLQALGSTAEQASSSVEALVQMSTQIPVATAQLLQAQVRMQAVGIPLAQISTLMQDVAGSSAAMGTNLNRATMQVDNMINSGTVAATTLSRLGISTATFVSALNSVAGAGTADITNFAAAFKQLDQTQAIQVVETAMAGLQSSLQQQTQTMTGQLQILDNSWEAVMVDIGDAIAPTTAGIVQFLSQDIVPAIKAVTAGFLSLPAPIQQFVVSLGVLAVAGAVAATAIGAFSLSMAALGSAAVAGPIIALGTAFYSLVAPIGEALVAITGLDAAIGTLDAVALPALVGLLGVAAAVFAGWQLGHWLSDAINYLTGFTGATQTAKAAVTAISGAADTSSQVLQTLGATTDTSAGKSSAFSSVLQTLGVSLDDLSKKGTTAAATLLSFNNAAQEVATQAQNLVTNYKNAELVFNDTAKAVAAGDESATAYTTTLNALNKAQEAANGGLQDGTTAALLAANGFSLLQVSATNSQTAFTAAAAAYASGANTLSQYTTALTVMNKAQMDANNGIELGSTAALLAANDYVNIAAKATNAATTVSALGTAAANGAASWTQYDTALKQLVADEEAANNGLVSLNTEVLVQQEAFQNLGVTEANAQTTLEAIVQVLGAAAVGTKAYTDALNALNTAQENANGGLMTFQTAMQLAENSQAQLNIAYQNAQTALAGALAYYQKTGLGIEQVIADTEKLAAAQTAASNGIIAYTDAQTQLSAQNTQLTLNLQNANTILAQATQMYQDGTIGLGQLEKAQQAVTAAQTALNGATTTGTTATKALATAQTGLASAFGSVKGAAAGSVAGIDTSVNAMTAGQIEANNYASSLQYVGGQWVNLGNAAVSASTAAVAAATGMQVLNGQFVNLGQAAITATNTGLSPFATQLQVINGQFVTMASSAPGAAAGIQSVGSAAASALQSLDAFSSEASSLGSQLDKLMDGSTSLAASLDAAFGDTGIKLGDMSMSLTPGEQISQPTPGTYISGAGMGLGQGQPGDITTGGPSSSATPYGDTTSTYDPAGVAQAAAAAATAITTTADTVTTASTAMAAALQQVTDANVLEQQAAAAQGTAAYASLKSVADAASDAAAAALASADATNTATAATTAATAATIAATTATTGIATSVAGLSSAALNSGNAIVALGNTVTTAASSLNVVSTTAANLSGVLNDSAESTETALNSLTVASEAAATAAAANAKTPVITPVGQDMYSSSLAAGSGVGGTPNTMLPYIGGGSGSGIGSGVAPQMQTPTSLVINLSNNGTVVGQNGIQQFSQIVGNNIVQSLGRMGIRLNRQ